MNEKLRKLMEKKDDIKNAEAQTDGVFIKPSEYKKKEHELMLL